MRFFQLEIFILIFKEILSLIIVISTENSNTFFHITGDYFFFLKFHNTPMFFIS